MTRFSARLSLLTALLFTIGITAQAQGPQASPPPHARAAVALATSWIDAFNAGDSASLAAFIGSHFAPEALGGRPLNAVVTRERWRSYNLGAATIVRVDSATDSSASILVRHPLVDGWGHLTVVTTPGPNPQVRALQLSRMESPPADLAARGRLSDAQVAAELDRFAARLAAAGHFAGTVGIVHDGALVMQSAYGLANRERAQPVQVGTRFELASVGKMFTTAVVARLVEQGQLRYEDTLGTWIPDFPNARARREVTVRHLLTHSSGIADYFMNPEWDALDKRELATQPLETHFRFFAGEPLAFAPGSDTRYANSNFLLLGIIAERVTKRSFRSLVDEMVFAPTHMSATWREAGTAPRATGYTVFGPRRMLDLSGSWRVAADEPAEGTPAGGGISTLGDMLRFASGLLDGRIISPSALRVLVARHGIGESPTSWSGYGFDSVEDWGGVRVANKSGSTYGVHTQFELYPEAGYGVVVLSNVESWAAEAIAYKARELLGRR